MLCRYCNKGRSRWNIENPLETVCRCTAQNKPLLTHQTCLLTRRLSLPHPANEKCSDCEFVYINQRLSIRQAIFLLSKLFIGGIAWILVFWVPMFLATWIYLFPCYAGDYIPDPGDSICFHFLLLFSPIAQDCPSESFLLTSSFPNSFQALFHYVIKCFLFHFYYGLTFFVVLMNCYDFGKVVISLRSFHLRAIVYWGVDLSIEIFRVLMWHHSIGFGNKKLFAWFGKKAVQGLKNLVIALNKQRSSFVNYVKPISEIETNQLQAQILKQLPIPGLKDLVLHYLNGGRPT
jgi:hypothetical protein